MIKKRLLFHIIEFFLSILIFIVLFNLTLKFIIDYGDKTFLFNNKESEKIKELDSSDFINNLYNFNPSNSSNIYRIVVIGDSVVKSNCPYVELLEERLDKHLKGLLVDGRRINEFNVINAFRVGGDIKGISNGIKEIYENNVKIDLLFIFSGWNEHWYNKDNNPCVRAGCYRNFKTYRWLLNLSKSENQLTKNLATKAFLHQRDKQSVYCEELFQKNMTKFLEGIDHYNTSIYRVSLNLYEEKLTDIINITRNHSVNVILVTPPDGLTKGEIPQISIKDCTLIDNESYFDIHHLYVNKLKEVANKLDVPTLDLEYLFEKVPNYKNLFFNNRSSDPIHPNIKGNLYCTELYCQKIASLLQEDSKII